MSADNENKIVEIIRRRGPSLPSQINKELNTDTLFASAMLGELVSNNVLKITNLKRASSPYYYLEEQRASLQNFSEFLNDKDKMAFDLIKQKGVLKDDNQTPLIRVTLRAIKDFAIQLQINHNGETSIFWKWYLLDNETVKQKIEAIIGIKKEKKDLPAEKIEKEIQKPKTKLKEKTLIQKTIVKKEPKPILEQGSTFLDYVKEYFKKNDIAITSFELSNKRGTEIDFIVELPSSVGKLQYYCKAKSKKKINDSDIASAMIQGQQKKLPILILLTGEMTKKSKEMLNKEFIGIKVQKI